MKLRIFAVFLLAGLAAIQAHAQATRPRRVKDVKAKPSLVNTVAMLKRAQQDYYRDPRQIPAPRCDPKIYDCESGKPWYAFSGVSGSLGLAFRLKKGALDNWQSAIRFGDVNVEFKRFVISAFVSEDFTAPYSKTVGVGGGVRYANEYAEIQGLLYYAHNTSDSVFWGQRYITPRVRAWAVTPDSPRFAFELDYSADVYLGDFVPITFETYGYRRPVRHRLQTAQAQWIFGGESLNGGALGGFAGVWSPFFNQQYPYVGGSVGLGPVVVEGRYMFAMHDFPTIVFPPPGNLVQFWVKFGKAKWRVKD